MHTHTPVGASHALTLPFISIGLYDVAAAWCGAISLSYDAILLYVLGFNQVYKAIVSAYTIDMCTTTIPLIVHVVSCMQCMADTVLDTAMNSGVQLLGLCLSMGTSVQGVVCTAGWGQTEESWRIVTYVCRIRSKLDRRPLSSCLTCFKFIFFIATWKYPL